MPDPGKSSYSRLDITTKCSSEIPVLQAPTARVQHGFREPMSSPQAGAREGRDSQRALQSPASTWHGCSCTGTNKPVWTEADSSALLKLIMLQARATEVQCRNISMAELLHGTANISFQQCGGSGVQRQERAAAGLAWGETLHWGRRSESLLRNCGLNLLIDVKGLKQLKSLQTLLPPTSSSLTIRLSRSWQHTPLAAKSPGKPYSVRTHSASKNYFDYLMSGISHLVHASGCD